MSLVLRVENVWKSYSAGVRGCSARVWVLRGCGLRVERGERVAIVGARGSGKSTLLQCIAGARRTDAGSITATIPILGFLTGEVTSLSICPDADTPALLLVDGPRPAEVSRHWSGAMILSSHDVASVHHLVDRVLLLRDGRMTPLLRPAVRRVAEHSPCPRPGDVR